MSAGPAGTGVTTRSGARRVALGAQNAPTGAVGGVEHGASDSMPGGAPRTAGGGSTAPREVLAAPRVGSAVNSLQATDEFAVGGALAAN